MDIIEIIEIIEKIVLILFEFYRFAADLAEDGDQLTAKEEPKPIPLPEE